MTKTRLTGVQYKGAAPAMTEVIGGHTQVMFNTVITTLPHVRSGRLRALATTGATRLPSLPDLPTVAEAAGVPGYEYSSWTVMGAPARTSPAIIERLNKEVAAILQMSNIQEKHATAGAVIMGGTPAQARDYVRAEYAKFGKLVKEAGLQGRAGGS